ncbi:hypothetical protein PHYBLDRAFT_161422 [Phycomyces blakesleeanus NRRL 1555(-)]|uniref:Uncharacterized protein n=1 Tax=Phycomyces blakesleeanus (strain ATCC 8743b / DSM 1359 / FGSC 10004 / NBRC 33097 / NRRL 1555) TaxID=763407 RepID=A0A163EQ50_PHYB8|nr:hypothetical protein PHYBLDRAFT_161422 [Phycomyces blakesleeanus NRRL 1555(-)]OAD80780.1 hypothetical protein PHYBLDRAFT_161422 [Phycomyces blakesleeanus NRRL 1555(-)]|eukprot:XP_018298820.1 hypothetical protein PHYBLDRAFT_161422 [Phycomyces blakesleeanus NRRL 1555(-)]
MSTTSLPHQRSSSNSSDLLPLPRDLDEDSFSRDLIHQFDKKRSRLRLEMVELENSHDAPSLHSSATPPTMLTVSPSPPTPTPAPAPPPSTTSTSPDPTNRRRSAGDLLRRSSAYFKSKLDAFKVSRSHDNLRDVHSIHDPTPSKTLGIRHLKKKPTRQDLFSLSSTSLPPPAKIAINTTIAIPQFQHNTHHQTQQATLHAHFGAIKPPVISQYPPKPLRYSPVDPPNDDHRPIVHRISLPLLRRNQPDPNEGGTTRRRSDTEATHQKKKAINTRKSKKGKERANLAEGSAL